jgi:ribosomal protein S6
MEKYELTVVLDEKTTPAKIKSQSEKINNLATTFKGVVTSEKNWGKIDFAYPIGRFNAGEYIHYELELDKSNARAFNTKLSADDQILRYLFIRRDN